MFINCIIPPLVESIASATELAETSSVLLTSIVDGFALSEDQVTELLR